MSDDKLIPEAWAKPKFRFGQWVRDCETAGVGIIRGMAYRPDARLWIYLVESKSLTLECAEGMLEEYNG